MPAVLPVVGAVAGAAISSKGAKDAAKITAEGNKIDPRLAAILHGGNGQQGLLSQYQGMLNDPRSAAGTGFANANADYLNTNGAGDMAATRNAALQAMQGNQAPMSQSAQAGYSQSAGTQMGMPAQSAGTQMGAAPQAASSQAGAAMASLPAYAVGAQVQAPSQNGMNLSGSYDSLINGAPGANPYLTGAVQKGINQSQNAFGSMVTDAKAATQDVLGSIRGNSVLSGQFGGSRQGIAEGKAIDSMNTNLSRAASQFGQNNTDAAVAAQASAYNTDRDRQLAATQGLGAQQYGVAQQNAANAQQAEMANVGNLFDASKTNANMAQQNGQFNASLGQQNNQFNAGLAQQTGLTNANLGQQNNQFNAGLAQQTGLTNANLGQQNQQFNANLGQNNLQFNAGLAQQTGLANQNAQLTTNAQNNGQLLGGAGLLSGLSNQASGQVNANDNWKLQQAQGVNSLLQPYLSGVPNQQPVASNAGAAGLGGAMQGMAFGNSLGNMFGGSTSGSGATALQTTGSAANYQYAPSQLPVQSFGYGF